MIMQQQLVQFQAERFAKAIVSAFNVPSDSGTVFLAAREPAIAIGPIIGKYLPMSITVPQAIFQNGTLSPKPFKPGTVICG